MDNETADRNSVSLTCEHPNKSDKEQRKFIRVGYREGVGYGLDPGCGSLTCICSRFPNLKKLEIVYSGWESKLGKQLDDQGLRVLSSNCPFLNDLTLGYCDFISDAGILSVVMDCKKLTGLHLIGCLKVCGAEWLEYLGKLETLEDLCIKNCIEVGEVELIKLGPSWGKLKRLQFEVHADYNYMKSYDRLAIDRWQKQFIPCSSMLELSLVNCTMNPGIGLGRVGLACLREVQ